MNIGKNYFIIVIWLPRNYFYQRVKIGILELIVMRCVAVRKNHATHWLVNVQMMVAKWDGQVAHAIKVNDFGRIIFIYVLFSNSGSIYIHLYNTLASQEGWQVTYFILSPHVPLFQLYSLSIVVTYCWLCWTDLYYQS